MKNSIGTNVTLTLFGESHGPAVGAVIDGLPPGLPVDTERIVSQLAFRRPQGRISTLRREKDAFEILSGTFNGFTTGTPLCIVIPNEEHHSTDYEASRGPARPGHADYTAHVKYRGFEDYRGGGHFSGRVTAALVAAGAIALTALEQRGIRTGTHIASLGGICDRDFAIGGEALAADIEKLAKAEFAVLDEEAAELMRKAIIDAAESGDSVGGVLDTAVTGLPAGIGEPWFDTLEGVLAHGLFSIPGIKGVQFGAGFDLVDSAGSVYNDPLRLRGGQVVTETNNNGGINGGISNGMPLRFRCAVKPTPSIGREQQTVDILKGEETVLSVKGRHDPAIIHRARVVVDSVTALILCDMLAQRYGTDWTENMP